MLFHFADCARGVAAVPLKAFVVLVALVFVVVGDAGAVNFAVGPKEVIYTKKQRTDKKLGTWPDGNLGVVRNAQGTFDFYGANGRNPAKTTGPSPLITFPVGRFTRIRRAAPG
jgi:hypothetical protein